MGQRDDHRTKTPAEASIEALLARVGSLEAKVARLERAVLDLSDTQDGAIHRVHRPFKGSVLVDGKIQTIHFETHDVVDTSGFRNVAAMVRRGHLVIAPGDTVTPVEKLLDREKGRPARLEAEQRRQEEARARARAERDRRMAEERASGERIDRLRDVA